MMRLENDLVATKLMDISFKEKIYKEAKHLFYDPKFIELLDENHNLLGFANGVYDLKLSKFRAGRPDDYISLSTNNVYREWNPKNKLSQEVVKFFETIFPYSDVRKYFLQVLSTCISGENKKKSFIVLLDLVLMERV